MDLIFFLKNAHYLANAVSESRDAEYPKKVKRILITQFCSIKVPALSEIFRQFFVYTKTCVANISLNVVFQLPRTSLQRRDDCISILVFIYAMVQNISGLLFTLFKGNNPIAFLHIIICTKLFPNTKSCLKLLKVYKSGDRNTFASISPKVQKNFG